MTDGSIPKQVLQNLGQIAEETSKEALKQTVEMTNSVITGKELLGNIKPMTEEEFNQKKAEDENKKQEEMKNLTGRNVEAEIKQVRGDKKEEEEKQEKFLEQIRQQREAEERERAQLAVAAPGNAKKEAAKRQMAPHGKKTSQPDPAAMSQTAEFKGKID
jgi:hydroxylamine reductase (hybrid-cluster protein)